MEITNGIVYNVVLKIAGLRFFFENPTSAGKS